VDAESLPHLKGEIERLFINERRRRVELWINGIVKSSPMLPRINPNFIGSEEVAVRHRKFPSYVLIGSFCFIWSVWNFLSCRTLHALFVDSICIFQQSPVTVGCLLMFALRCVCLAELLIRRLSCNCFAYSVLNRAIFMCSFIFFIFILDNSAQYLWFFPCNNV
jgi:hypothetical protein